MGGTDEKDTPIIRERKDFNLFREMTRRLNEKDRLIFRPQSTEIISKTEGPTEKMQGSWFCSMRVPSE